MIQNRARKQHQDRAGEEGGRRPGEPILFNVGQRSPFWLSILKYGFCQYSISNSVAILWYLWLAGIIFSKITTFVQVSGEEIWEEADKKEQVLYLQKIGDLKTKTPTVKSLFKIPDTNSWWFQFVFAAWKGFEILLWHLLLSSSRPYQALTRKVKLWRRQNFHFLAKISQMREGPPSRPLVGVCQAVLGPLSKNSPKKISQFNV